MAQISKGDTFTDGQQVTGARLNQLVDSSSLLIGAITDQPSITANTLQATDSTIVNDGGVLKEATIGDFLNSNLPITTSSITTSAINGIAGADIAVAPAAGQKFDVNGAFESTTSNTTSNATIGGTLTVTGTTTLTGNATANGSFTSNGTANFTGAFQINGSVGYVLYEIATLTLPAPVSINAITNSNVATTANFGAKPSDEIWVFKCRFNYLVNGYPFKVGVRYSTETIYSGNYLAIESRQDASGGSAYAYTHFNHEWVIPQGTALSGTTLSVDVSNSGGSGEIFSISKNMDGIGTASWAGNSTLPPVIFIYKYKTA